MNYAFVISPYLYALENNEDVEWIYLSYEMDRISQEFDFATYFLYHDFGIEEVKLKEGSTVKGENTIELSPDYLRGRVMDDNEEIIKVNSNVEKALKEVYKTRLIPLFGEYDENGKKIKKGKITFLTNRDNPTGIYKKIIAHAEKEGEFIYEGPEKYKRKVGYVPNNPNKTTIIIIDTMRKLVWEQGFKMKGTVDKISEYIVELRELLPYTYVGIIHLNREISSIGTLREYGDEIYPNSDMVEMPFYKEIYKIIIEVLSKELLLLS